MVLEQSLIPRGTIKGQFSRFFNTAQTLDMRLKPEIKTGMQAKMRILVYHWFSMNFDFTLISPWVLMPGFFFFLTNLLTFTPPTFFFFLGNSPRRFNPSFYRKPAEYNQLLTSAQVTTGNMAYGFEIVLSRSVKTYIKVTAIPFLLSILWDVRVPLSTSRLSPPPLVLSIIYLCLSV